MNKLGVSIASSMLLLGLSGTAMALNLSDDFKKIEAFFTQSHKHKKNHVNLLFLQQADSGTIVPLAKKPGCYSLTLSNLHDSVLYFTDQPTRKAGNITTREFIEVWKHNTIVPNVAMQAFAVSPNDIRELNLVATLKEPQYNQQAKTISYTTCIITKANKQKPKIAKSDLRSVNLFIDPLNQWPP